MLTAYSLAIAQLGDRRMVAVLVKSLALTLLVFAAIGVGLWYALAGLAEDGTVSALAATIATLVLFWLAFRAVAIAVVGLFGDDVVRAVEQRHYPAAAARARAVPLVRSAVMGARSVLRLVGYNALATPLYVAAAITGIGLPVAFFSVNGWLLGRDLGDMVAARHLRGDALADWRRATRGQRLVAGLLATGLFAVPVVNLIAPVVGAAAMTHLFHRRRA